MTASDSGGPAALASATSEPAEATPAVHAIGVGPGDPAYLSERARELLAAADVVVGFETVLDVVRESTDAECLGCGYDDQAETLGEFASAVADGDAGVTALMGDPNVSGYQFLGRVERAVDGPVRVVPGISSIQVAASRARTPLERSTIASLHRRGSLARPLDRLAADAGERHLVVIPRPYDWMPGDVAGHLVESGADPDLPALVLEELTLDGESITRCSLGDLAADAGGNGPDGTEFSDLSVLVVRAPDATTGWNDADGGT